MFRAQHEGTLKRLARMYLKGGILFFIYTNFDTLPLQQTPSPPLQSQCRFCLHPTLGLFWRRTLKHNVSNYQLILYSLYKWGGLKRTHHSQIQGEVYLPPRRGKTTYLTKERTPLFWMLPGSQNAFFSFFFTSSLVSRRSIFDSCSQNRTWYKWPY